MHTPSNHLFVYGSLLSGFKNPAYAYLSQYFNFVGEAGAKGLFFDNGSYPVAVPTTEEHWIKGELYELKDTDEFSWAIAQLDDYEGLNVEPGELPMYKRELTNAYVDGQPQLAWVYWYNMPTDGMPPIDTSDVLAYISKK